MRPIEFEEQTVVYAEHQDEYMNLPAWKDEDDPEGRIICCWQLTWWERIQLLFTGRIWHHVLTFRNPLQPQLLEVGNPFIYKAEVNATAKES